jgi:hypothetical protein
LHSFYDLSTIAKKKKEKKSVVCRL